MMCVPSLVDDSDPVKGAVCVCAADDDEGFIDSHIVKGVQPSGVSTSS